MTAARRIRNTYAEYLRIEAESPTRHEFIAGEIYAMAGGTIAHAVLASAVASIVAAQKPKCRVLGSDARVRVDATELATYPDVTLVCGAIQRSIVDRNGLTNPMLLVEVTSQSTEEYDRGAKLAHYQHLTSLEAVLFVSHRSPRLTLVKRTPDGWITTDHGPGAIVSIPSLELSIAVDDVFRDVELDPE